MTGDHFFIQIFQNKTGFFSQARCFAGHLTNIVKAPKKTKMTRFASHLNSDLNYNFQTSHFISTFLSTHADRLDVDISFTVCYLFFLFVRLWISPASGVKFCIVVYGRPGQGISHFGELCSPRSPKSDGSACVDNHQSPPLAVLVALSRRLLHERF